MNPIDHLASLLAPALRVGGAAMPVSNDIDGVIEALERRVKSGGSARAPEDLQMDAVRRFWQRPRLENLRDARLVAFGMALPAGPDDTCLFDDAGRLGALLDGIDQWLDQPRWYRRCYQGLLRNYFDFDAHAPGVTTGRRQQWERLRGYLLRRALNTLDARSNPDWVQTVVAGRHLFGESPCTPYIDRLLGGRREEIDLLCERLGIQGSSWFMRQLLEEQIVAATRLDDDAFCALLPSLIEMLAGARTLRDAGLARLLERHAQSTQLPAHDGLRDAALGWWGSPWATSGGLQWNGLSDKARDMAFAWLKADFIDRFFAGSGDGGGRRRAGFWARYVKLIQRIDFPEGESAGQARAMVMTIGGAAVVAFADPRQPLHLHDLRRPQPFELAHAVSGELAADLRLPYRDGLDGWRQWEQMFDAALMKHFGIRVGAALPVSKASFVDLSDLQPADDPGVSGAATDEPRWHSASVGEDVHWLTAEAASVPYSRPDLEVLARVHALQLDDQASRSGMLWVRTDASDRRIARVLSGWGFAYAPGEGWSRRSRALDPAFA
jgi:EH_Signature domain